MENKAKKIGFNFDNSYSRLSQCFFSKEKPIASKKPELVILNYPLVKELDLNKEELETIEGIHILSGKEILEEMNPIAEAYCGHQFGNFTMLGDGRAVLLGEHINKKQQSFDIALKGSGQTTYSRGGDGRAALGPMLREYIISEAINALKVPTTRTLAVITTGEEIYRDGYVKGAMVVRVASSHLRVGTFQYGDRFCSKEQLKELADYAINKHYKYLKEEENPYRGLLREVIKKQAALVAKWQLIGFVHGVMNTDNMTISGETIDYGPCAFIDLYNPKAVFSSIDYMGRYAYGNQPNIAGWNLARFAETLIGLFSENREEAIVIAQEEFDNYPKLFKEFWLQGMRKKLGLVGAETIDEYIIDGLLAIMEKEKLDFTNTFYLLTIGSLEKIQCYNKEEFTKWKELWNDRLKNQSISLEESREIMRENNPVIIPRNHRVEEALKAAESNDFSIFNNLVEALKNPYDYKKDLEFYREGPKDNGPYVTYCGT